MNNRTQGDTSMPFDAEELAWRQLSQGLQDLARKPAVDIAPDWIALELAEADLSAATAH